MTSVPDIKQDIQILKELQVLDKEIYDLEQELILMPLQVADLERDYKEAVALAEAFEQQIKDVKVKQKDKEGELSQKEGGIQKLQVQLNLVKTNKEYTAIQHEIASAKADNSVLEEKILEFMDEVETINKKLAEQKKKVQEEEKILEGRKQELKQKQEVHGKRIEQLKNDRKSLAERVSSETAALYERILKKKEGLAIVSVNGENCGYCQIQLRAQIQNDAKLQTQITLCESCSRILYAD